MNREIDQDLPWASRHRAWLLFWGILAAANLGAGLAISRWAERQSDLRRVAEWCALWTQGVNVYGLRAEFVDYPPHAIVLLSPLAWVQSFEHLVGVWAAANLMLAVTAAYLAVRLVRPGASLHAAAVPVLMFLTWGGFRTLLQFSLLALTLGLAATVLANRRPIVSGVLLGLSLIKPQVAIPFVLWPSSSGDGVRSLSRSGPCPPGTCCSAFGAARPPPALRSITRTSSGVSTRARPACRGWPS